MNERDIPKPYQKLYAKAKTGRSQAAAIRSFYLECVGYEYQEVKICTDIGCPLYEYRLTGRKVPRNSAAPFQRKAKFFEKVSQRAVR